MLCNFVFFGLDRINSLTFCIFEEMKPSVIKLKGLVSEIWSRKGALLRNEKDLCPVGMSQNLGC